VKDVCLLVAAVLLQVIGNLCLSQGMRQIGELDIRHPTNWNEFIHHILQSQWVLAGLICLGTFFACFLVALSRLDFSYVQPMLAAHYVLTAVLAGVLLHESVSGVRWLGIVCIAAGVAVVGWDDRKRRRRKSVQG
jgi:bacterial/archaeal transporter family protein